MAEWKDADYTDREHPISARTALNQVRKAANMPEITATGEEFKSCVHRERRVVLAFEDHRFWDIRRWKIGKETNRIYRMKITRNSAGGFDYQKELLETRQWSEKMNLYPIPQSEYYINPNLGQNPGW